MADHNVNQDFDRTPMALNVVAGEEAVFQCQHSTASDLQWLLNGFSTVFGRPGIQISTMSSPDGIYEQLMIETQIEHNQTSIECVAEFSDGSLPLKTPSVTLGVQGPLEAVQYISRNLSTITWDPPFTLNLTTADPDIIYCVEVYNITCGQREGVLSDCLVTEPIYEYTNFTDLLNTVYIFDIVVIPRSYSDNARNGTSRTRKEKFVSLMTQNYSVQILDYSNESEVNEVLVKVTLNFHVQGTDESSYVPSWYTLMLESNDGLYDSTQLVNLQVARDNFESGNILPLSPVNGLPLRRLWSATVLGYDCKQNRVSDKIELSTHDFKSTTITIINNTLTIYGYFIESSPAMSALIVIYATNNDSDIHYLRAKPKGNQRNIEIVHDLRMPNTTYNISIFVVGVGGLPLNRSVGKPQSVTGILSHQSKDSSNHQSPVILYSREIKSISNSNESDVCVTCIFINRSPSECVVLTHRRISQLNSSGLMNIISSYKFARSGDTASGCISAVNLEIYQVGVVQGRLETKQESDHKPVNCDMMCYVAICCASVLTLFGLVVFFAGILCFYIKKQARHTPPHQENKIEMKECYAYEVPSMARRRMEMTENRAYATVGPQY